MCGIVASINLPFNTQKVNEVMGHRGPDERNSFSLDNVLMHHLRLSIVDIAGGKQPMHYLDRYTIIFNGEIYNHLDVRKQLQLNCISNSDTETLLQAYHLKGANMLPLLDGMFAFIIYDSVEKKIFIARDRAGKKPLYYVHEKNVFLFASELNCIKSLIIVEADTDVLAGFFRTGYILGNNTPYKNVRELPKGSWMEIHTSTLTITSKQWWNIKDYYKQPTVINFEEAITTTNSFLHQAVKRRLESSDIEVGAFLSGGIDSGIVTAIAAQYTNKLKTFTVAFDGEYNEAPLAKLVAEKYATEHTELKIDFSNIANDVEHIIAQYGEPFFDSSCIPSYYVSQEARKHVTVILNGDGADELFGGYRRYVPFTHFNFYKPNILVNTAANTLYKLLPKANNKKTKYNYVHRLINLASVSGYKTFLRSGTDIFDNYEQYLLNPYPKVVKEMDENLEQVYNMPISALQKAMLTDFDIGLYNMLLIKMDIATMAHSLEGRSPFLCKELLEYAPTLADNFKIKGSETKYLLRQLAKKYLPEPLIHQPKRGFEIPLKNWVNGSLKELMSSYIFSNNAQWVNYIDKPFVFSVLEGKIEIPAEKRAKMLWSIFCFEVWYKNDSKINSVLK